MRTHAQIIQATGTTAFGRRISAEPNNVHQWKRSDSIPAPYWQAVADAGLATLDELAAAAALKVKAEGVSGAAA